MAFTTLRRLYLLSRRYALSLQDYPAAGFWRWKQEQIPWPDLPSGFPSRAKLITAGYQTVRDLDGADQDELKELGLSTSQANAVLAAMEDWPMPITKQLKSYVQQDGRSVEAYDAPLLGSAARTASGNGDAYEIGDGNTLRLKLVVSAASGTTPTLDVKVQTSEDAVTWRDCFLFGQKTTTTTGDKQSFSNLDRFVRASYTIGGTTPSFTFSLTGELV